MYARFAAVAVVLGAVLSAAGTGGCANARGKAGAGSRAVAAEKGPALADVFARAVFAGCSDVVLQEEESGSFVATRDGLAVEVAARERCIPDKNGALYSFGLRTSDESGVLATVDREQVFTGDCNSAMRELRLAKKHPLFAANDNICTDGMQRPAPVMLDLRLLLEPTFSARGPLTSPAASASATSPLLTWTVDGTPFTIDGDLSCVPDSAALEAGYGGARGALTLRPWLLKVSFDVRSRNSRLHSVRKTMRLPGRSCEHAFSAGLSEAKVDKTLREVLQELEPSLR